MPLCDAFNFMLLSPLFCCLCKFKHTHTESFEKRTQDNQLPCVILLHGKDGYNKSGTTWITACTATSNQICIQFLDFLRSKLVAETSLLWIVFFYLSKFFTRLHTSCLLKNAQKTVTSTEICTILTDFQLLTPQDKA